MKAYQLKKPDFIIVGAMKAGTTTLVDLLKYSSEIYIHPKEINFFDKIEQRSLTSYQKIFEPYAHLVCGEKTAAYSYAPDAAPNIAKYLPDVKLIWLLRNPIDRAYSNYWHIVKAGKEKNSFEQCVKMDEIRYKKNIYRAYLKRSQYVEQIEYFLEYFKMEQMFFIIAEELNSNPIKVINELAEFLKINTFEFEQKKRKNKTFIPRSLTIETLSREYFGNSFIYKVIHQLNKSKNPGYPELDDKLRFKLNDYFRSYNDKLSTLIGKKLEIWDE